MAINVADALAIKLSCVKSCFNLILQLVKKGFEPDFEQQGKERREEGDKMHGVAENQV